MKMQLCAAAWLLLTVVALPNHNSTAWAYADITWSAGGSDLSWSNTANWNPQTLPTSADNVFFAEAGGKVQTPGQVTNSLAADQTVQNLTYLYTNNSLNYQTTNLEGHTLHVNGTLAVKPQSGDSGRWTLIQNGTLEIGDAKAPGNLYVSNLAGSGGFLGLIDTKVNAVLDSIAIAQAAGPANSSVSGSLLGGKSGTIVVGSQATPGNIYVAHSLSDADTTGSLTLSGQDSLQAVVHNFWIGTSDGNSTASGRVTLANSNNIQADSIIVGNSHEDGVPSQYESTLQLGQSNNILANQFLIGAGMSETTVTIPAGGIVNIGSENVATDLIIGRSDAKVWYSFDHSVDFSGAEFNAHLSNLTVGESLTSLDSVGPNLRVTFKGGNQGTISVGSPTAPGVIAIGHVDGNGSTNSAVDFSGQTQLNAHLQRFDVGVSDSLDSTSVTTPSGILTLAQSNMIDVPVIRIGTATADAGNSYGTLRLGHNTTILADKVIVSAGISTGTIQAAADSTVVLGDASRRMELQVGIGLRDDSNYADGEIDLTGANVTAWLDNVTLGYAHDQNAKILVKGELSLGSQGYVNAKNIMMADGATSWGELNLGGAELIADQITRGAGKAEFFWTAGRLEVGQFGSIETAFDLQNTVAGTLVTGHEPGNPLHVYGNYQQGAQATFETHEHLGQIDLAIVSQNAMLDGTLNLVLPDGFSPTLGEQFTLLTAATISGQFAHVKGYYLGSDTVLLPIYQANSVLLQAYRAGDANLDGNVDGADYTAWADHFLTSMDTVAKGDFNGDGFVDGADYTVWADHFAPAQLTLSAVPEPSTLALAGIGALALIAFARRRTAR